MIRGQKIRELKLKTDLWVALIGFIKGILRSSAVLLLAFLSISFLDSLFQMPALMRQLFWVLIMLVGSFLFLSGWWPLKSFLAKTKSTNLARGLRQINGKISLRDDDFSLACEFLKSRVSEGCSEEILQLFLDDFTRKLDFVKIWWASTPWNWRRTIVLFLGCLIFSVSLWALFPTYFPIETRTVFPFLTNQIEKFLTVKPGNCEVDWGSDALVEVVLKEKSIFKPALFVKKEEGWEEIKEENAGQTTTFKFQNIVKPINYKILWKNEWTQKFVISAIKPVQIEAFQISVVAPEYLGGKITEFSSPEISGNIGSTIKLEALVSAPIENGKILFSNGKELDLKVLKKTRIFVEFIVSGDLNYGFLFNIDGKSFSIPAEYPIYTTPDRSPEIILLSPSEDLLISNTEKLPLTYQATDDYGIGNIFLEYETENGKRSSYRIGITKENPDKLLDTFQWNLSQFPFKPGEAINYRLLVEDKNTLSGPGKGYSDWRIIEISSFEKKHDAIETLLELWRDKTLEALAQTNSLEEKTKDEKNELTNLMPELSRLALGSAQLQMALKEIVQMMEKDPLSDYRVWLEHKAMLENLEAINTSLMPSIEGSLLTKNRIAAQRHLRELAAEFERMTTLSENLSKDQKAQDMVNYGENLEDIGDDLVSRLEDLKNQTPKNQQEIFNQIQEFLRRAQDALSSLAHTIQKMPQDLPEDFINQEAIKNLEIGKSQDILSQINDALKRGDFNEALQLAQSFLKAAEKMSHELSRAQDSYQEGISAENLSNDLNAQQTKLNEIVDSQRRLLAETQKMESKRLRQELQMQEKILERLAKRQEAVIERTKSLLPLKELDGNYKTVLQSLLPNMETVFLEMKSKKMEKGVELLNSIVGKMADLKDSIDKSSQTKSYFGDIRWIGNEEAEILNSIQAPLDFRKMAGEEERRTFGDLGQQQFQLRDETQTLKNSCQILSRKTAQLGSFISESMGSAISEMEKASGNLKDYDSRGAQNSQEKAMDYLLEGQSMLEQIQNSMSMIRPGHGKGRGGQKGMRVISRGGNTGTDGTKIGRVKIPTVDDYRPPKEFREELLEALKEKYPKNYDRIIQQYFKRLSE